MQGTVKNFGKSYGFICGENDKEYIPVNTDDVVIQMNNELEIELLA